MPRSKSKRQKSPATPQRFPSSRHRSRSFRPRRLMHGMLIALAILAVPVTWIIMEVRSTQTLTNLDIIGSGEPVAVQIHEPGHADSERLRRNIDAARQRMDAELAFRVVNINTSRGARFAYEYGVSPATVMLFDANGEISRVVESGEGVDDLETTFTTHLKSAR